MSPWLSVYVGMLTGPKLRKFYKTIGCNLFEATGILISIWAWGLENADKDGKFLEIDRQDIEVYLRGVGVGCSLDYKEVVDGLFSVGWLDEGPDGIYIHEWTNWQKYWLEAKDRREKDVVRKRKKAEGNDPEEATTESEGEESGKKPNPDEAEKKPAGYSVPFEKFWEVYPRKDEKASAYKKYQARLREGFSDTQLYQSAENYASECRKMHTEKKYIKMCKTFLGENLPFMEFLPKKKKEERTENGTGKNPFSGWEMDNK